MWARRLIVFAVVLAALAGANQANARSCFGVKTNPNYLAAFDTVKNQKADGAVRYSQPRWLMEWQTWATPAGQAPGHHSEHIHVAACIPNGQTITGPYRLDLLYTAFNMVDYKVFQVAMNAVSKTGSNAIWVANDAQKAGVQAMLDRADPGAGPQTFALSVKVNAPPANGFKEIRNAITLDADGPDAVFLRWQHDPRWYYTDAWPSVTNTSEPLTNQRAIRVRPQVQFLNLDGVLKTDYHHSGFAGFGTCTFPNITDTQSDSWTRGIMSKPWRQSKTICLYNTDGGGQWFLEIDPNHHVHDPNAPGGEDHGTLVATEDRRFGSDGNPGLKLVTVPVSEFEHGSLHKLVFVSHDFPECAGQAGQTWERCPAGTRGTWTNVTVIPWRKK